MFRFLVRALCIGFYACERFVPLLIQLMGLFVYTKYVPEQTSEREYYL